MYSSGLSLNSLPLGEAVTLYLLTAAFLALPGRLFPGAVGSVRAGLCLSCSYGAPGAWYAGGME